VLSALLPALAAFAADGGGKLDPSRAPKRGQYVYDSFGAVVRSDDLPRAGQLAPRDSVRFAIDG